MKTLNEVIRANECCDHGELDSKCEDCPYNGIGACCAERESDALHYLRKYHNNLEARNDQIKRYQKAAQQCEEVLKDYIALKQIALRRDNPPLTWDELRTMEGKPVWIDSVPLVRRRVIIKKFHPIGGNNNLFDMEVEDGAHFLRKSMGRDAGAWWQAYRKERS